MLHSFQRHQLTTVEILYHMPDHPSLLQSFIWQELDIPPTFPKLKTFLTFWQRTLEGKLYSVKLAHSSSESEIILPGFLGKLS